MAKELWKPGNMLYPLPVVMITVRDEAGRDNIITAAWAGTVCTNPPMLSVAIRPERYSYGILKETGEFAVNLTTKELVYATDYCGVASGRDTDKFEKTGLHRAEAEKIGVSLIGESPVNIECRVNRIVPLGSHDLFIADVLCVHADQKYMNAQGKFDLALADPIVYSHGEYYRLGEKCGSFGFSVRRKRAKHKK